jgi:hypothetical protein
MIDKFFQRIRSLYKFTVSKNIFLHKIFWNPTNFENLFLAKRVLISLTKFENVIRAVPEINVRGGREAPFKTYNHPS